MFANEYLEEKLPPHGYCKAPHTPGLWNPPPFQFILFLNNFGVKYVGKEHTDHLIHTLKSKFTISKDWEGALYCGITLKWNYEEGWLEFGMPGYIKKVLQKYKPLDPPNT